MGLFSRIKDPVEGQFNLVSCSIASGGAVYENCSMDGVVSGPGVTPTSVHHSSLATPVAKWPQPGQTLPVTFDRQHPDRLKIRWDLVPTNREVAQQYAAQQAQWMAQQQAQQQTGQPAPGGQPADPSWPAQAGATWPAGMPQSAVQPGMTPDAVQDLINGIVSDARARGAAVTVTPGVIGDPTRPLPGTPGGGLTPQESAQALAGSAAALGLQPTTARVLAAHDVPSPPGIPAPPGGLWDITLDVTPFGGTPGYSTVLRIGFSTAQKQQAIAAVGRELPVLADPQRHDRIMIDTSRLA